VCGQGEEENRLIEQLDASGLAGKVNHLGYRSDIYAIMSTANVLVLPSWYEGMPNILVEAFAIGLPAIISDIPAHRDVLGGNQAALLFPPGSPQKLADHLISLFQNPERRSELAIQGKQLASEFSVERMVSAYAAYYRKVINSD
jgi:glycosyltransferase involved in cell wall biosynthesis